MEKIRKKIFFLTQKVQIRARDVDFATKIFKTCHTTKSSSLTLVLKNISKLKTMANRQLRRLPQRHQPVPRPAGQPSSTADVSHFLQHRARQPAVTPTVDEMPAGVKQREPPVTVEHLRSAAEGAIKARSEKEKAAAHKLVQDAVQGCWPRLTVPCRRRR
jgi:hypothetical protein